MRLAPVAALIAATTLLAAPAGAQAPAAPKTAVISIQPLAPAVGVYAAEFEKAIAPAVTFGIGGSYWNYDGGLGNTRYTSAEAKLRYYPGAHPFRGFSFGGQAGYSSLSNEINFGSGVGSQKSQASGPSVGVALDYGWLLGESKSYYVGLGLGAKKIFAKSSDIADSPVAYGTGRVSIGFAF